MKFAVVSHILPPSPSGQAVVLSRLLRPIKTDEYCLISCQNYEKPDHNSQVSSKKLDAEYFHMKSTRNLPLLSRFKILVLVHTLFEIFFRALQIIKIHLKKGCKVLVSCTGDLYDLPATCLAGVLTKTPVIVYIFDDYAYQWMGFYRSISRYLEPLIFKYAAHVIVTNEFMQKEYLTRYGLQSTIIHNPCSMPELDALDKEARIFNPDEINIVYTGSIYHAHYDAFWNLISAAEKSERNKVKIHLFTSQSEQELKANKITGAMIAYYPLIKASEVSSVLRQADILFLPLAFNSPIPEVIKTSSPGKFGEYLSVGRPVLVHAPQDCFVSWFVKDNHCGVVVDKCDSKILQKEIHSLVHDTEKQSDMGFKARQAAESNFRASEMGSRFYNSVLLAYKERKC